LRPLCSQAAIAIFCHCWIFLQTFGVQFNAAALGKQWRYEAYPSSIDFWMVNSIFRRATSPGLNGYAAAIPIVGFATEDFNRDAFLPPA
jgi:hypothetical protein